jgi:hypothetical protein
MASLASMLAGGAAGGLIWRSTFVVAGLIGLVEAVSFAWLRRGADALPSRILRHLDPVLYTTMVVVAFVPSAAFALTPLQLAGMATGGVFLVGLCFVWLAFAEPQDGGTGRPRPPPPPIPCLSRQGLSRPDPTPGPPSRSPPPRAWLMARTAALPGGASIAVPPLAEAAWAPGTDRRDRAGAEARSGERGKMSAPGRVSSAAEDGVPLGGQTTAGVVRTGSAEQHDGCHEADRGGALPTRAYPTGLRR